MYSRQIYNEKKHKEHMQEVHDLTGALCIQDARIKDTKQSNESILEFKFSCHVSSHWDDNVYEPGQSFDKLTKLMFNMYEDKIKKRVLRQGYGPIVLLKAMVSIQYKAYIENQKAPIDSTCNKDDYTLSLSGECLPGLCNAIKSMQIGEMSQFLMNAKFAYGELGSLNLESSSASVLFVVQLNNSVNQNENESFRDIYIAAHAICTKGNELFRKGLIKSAIKEYLSAVSHLKEFNSSNNPGLDERIDLLLLRIYTNLVVTYTKVHEIQKTCIYSQTVYDMCETKDLKIPVKVYINHARALILLSDFKKAEQILLRAKHIDSRNEEIANEFVKLNSIKEKKPPNYVHVKCIGLNKQPVEISKQFKDAMGQYCRDLINDYEVLQYQLPDELNKAEQEFILLETQKHGLYFHENVINSRSKYVVSKVRHF